MKNLKFKTLVGLYGLIVFSCLIQSCCEEFLTITETGGIYAWDLYEGSDGYIERQSTTTITGEFILGVYFQYSFSSLNNVSLVSSSYATSCKETLTNAIDKSTLGLSLNKSFVLNGDSIPAHANLLGIENSGVVLNTVLDRGVEFKFTESFFSNATLENGDCIIKFNGRTDDNVQLESELEVEVVL